MPGAAHNTFASLPIDDRQDIELSEDGEPRIEAGCGERRDVPRRPGSQGQKSDRLAEVLKVARRQTRQDRSGYGERTRRKRRKAQKHRPGSGLVVQVASEDGNTLGSGIAAGPIER